MTTLYGMTIVGVEDYTIPSCGNKHNLPYGKLRVLVNGVEKIKPIHEDYNGSYICKGKTKMYVHNVGSLYAPNYEFNGIIL